MDTTNVDDMVMELLEILPDLDDKTITLMYQVYLDSNEELAELAED
jgi:hypothetical protein